MYYTYILLSECRKKTYTGCTDNIQRRLEEHNRGKVKSSRAYRPYSLLYLETYELLMQACQRERYFKTTTGRRELRKRFFS